ncbi:LytR C-terminal domain-containing protein [Janibacter sp. GXQ6167]|uniref:LytR C-terminal domain-containing protein n=1 Tax=Janibacter sp. GXQ6167 TaxID=3240791 RepID=UPI0035237B2C
MSDGGGSGTRAPGERPGHREYEVVPVAELSPVEAEQYRRRWWVRVALFVSLPGLILGTLTVATAYGSSVLRGGETCQPIVLSAPARSDVRVRVLNANDTDGVASAVARTLKERGFTVTDVDNADDRTYVRGVATIYYGSAGLDHALLLQRQVPGARLWSDGRDGSSVTLVLGYGYRQLVDEPAPPPPMPDKVKVNVYNTTFREGLAQSASDDLADRGFRIGDVGNDPQAFHLPDDVGVIRYGPDGEGAAQRLTNYLDGVRLQKVRRDGTTVDLVLGNGYGGIKPASKVPAPTPFVRAAENIERPCHAP